jgi:hypothetical protein
MLLHSLPDAMCDLPEEELAEYLLWRERSSSPTEARTRSMRLRARETLLPTAVDPEPVLVPA